MPLKQTKEYLDSEYGGQSGAGERDEQKYIYLSQLYQEYRDSSYRREKLRKINEGRSRYDRDLPDKDFPWKNCSNKTLGLEFIAVNSLLPRIMAQIIGEEKWINAIPNGPEDAAQVESVEWFMQWAADHNIRAYETLKPLAHDILLDGTVDVLTMFETDKKNTRIRTLQPVFVNPQTGEEIDLPPQALQNPQVLQLAHQRGLIAYRGEREAFVDRQYDDWRVDWKPIPMADAFFPDDGKFEEQPYMRVIYPTLWYLEQNSDKYGGPYKNIDMNLVVDPGRTDEDSDDYDFHRKYGEHSDYSMTVELLECYYRWPAADGTMEWRIATYAHKSGWVEVRDQKMIEVYSHGRKPVRRFKIYGHSNESMGEGIPSLIMHESFGCDASINMMIDVGTLDAAFFGYIIKGPGWEGINLDTVLGRPIELPHGSQVIPPHKQAGTGLQFMEFVKLFLGNFERKLSLLDHALSGNIGRTGRGTETLGGMELLIAEADIQQNSIGEDLRVVLEGLVKDSLLLYARNLPQDAKVRTKDESGQWIFRDINPQSLQGGYDFKIQVSDNQVNKALRREAARQDIGMVAGYPGANVPELFKRYFEAKGDKEPDKVINPAYQLVYQAMQEAPQELAQVIQKFMAERQQQKDIEKVTGQAQDNIRRQRIQQKLENETGREDEKIINREVERAKGDMVRPAIRKRTAQKLISPGKVRNNG